MGYPVEFREMIVSKALSKEITQKQLIEEYGIGLSTLHKWLHAYKNQSISKVTDNEKPVRDWNDEEKWQALVDSEGLNEEDKGRYLRENGLFQHHLSHWKLQFMSKESPEKDKQLRAKNKELEVKVKGLEKELRRKEKALAETAALLVLQKKVQTLFGSDEDK